MNPGSRVKHFFRSEKIYIYKAVSHTFVACKIWALIKQKFAYALLESMIKHLTDDEQPQ